MLAPRAPAAHIAASLLALASSGCGLTQRCRVTPWFEVEHRRRAVLLPGVALGEDSASVRVLVSGGWVEIERRRSASYHRTRDGVLLLVLDAATGNAVEAHHFSQGSQRPDVVSTASCQRPVVLAERGALLCWVCTAPAPGPDPALGCAVAAFAELGLDGTGRWERSLTLPVSASGLPCRIDELYGLSAAGHPVVRLACPAPDSGPLIDRTTHTEVEVELRPEGFVEAEPGAIPHPPSSLAWVDRRCPRWAPGF